MRGSRGGIDFDGPVEVFHAGDVENGVARFIRYTENVFPVMPSILLPFTI
jgi:hypothetical protein